MQIILETKLNLVILKSHMKTWNSIRNRRDSTEYTLALYLHKIAQENFSKFLASRAEHNENSWEDEWESLKDQEDWNSFACCFIKQTSLLGITILSCVHDGVNFMAFDFNVGWDEEHGISILMHQDKILGTAGISEFTNCGDGLLDYLK
jgi:hypothetical protein